MHAHLQVLNLNHICRVPFVISSNIHRFLDFGGEHYSASHIVDVPQFNHSSTEAHFISSFRLLRIKLL